MLSPTLFKELLRIMRGIPARSTITARSTIRIHKEHDQDPHGQD
jgi:hypothetical protein